MFAPWSNQRTPFFQVYYSDILFLEYVILEKICGKVYRSKLCSDSSLIYLFIKLLPLILTSAEQTKVRFLFLLEISVFIGKYGKYLFLAVDTARGDSQDPYTTKWGHLNNINLTEIDDVIDIFQVILSNSQALNFFAPKTRHHFHRNQPRKTDPKLERSPLNPLKEFQVSEENFTNSLPRQINFISLAISR